MGMISGKQLFFGTKTNCFHINHLYKTIKENHLTIDHNKNYKVKVFILKYWLSNLFYLMYKPTLSFQLIPISNLQDARLLNLKNLIQHRKSNSINLNWRFFLQELTPNDKRFFLKIPQKEIDANKNIDESVNANR